MTSIHPNQRKIGSGPLPALAPHHAAPDPSPTAKPAPASGDHNTAHGRNILAAHAPDPNKLPWANNGALNAALTQQIDAIIACEHATSRTAINGIIHTVINHYRGKLQDWNYDWHESSSGKVMLALDFKGKMGMFDASGVTLADSVQRYAKHGGRQKVMDAALHQLNEPDQYIHQVKPNDCVAATLQKEIATLNPQKYFVIATSLVDHGKAALPNGTELSLSAKNRAYIEGQHWDENKRMNASFQCALMEYSVKLTGKKADFDFAKDTFNGQIPGLGIQAARSINDTLANRPTIDPAGLQGKYGGRLSQATEFKELEAAVRAHGGAFVAVQLGDKGAQAMAHMVLVKGFRGNEVELSDGEKGRWTMSKADFVKALDTSLSEQDLGGIGNLWGFSTTAGTGTKANRGAPTPTAGWGH